MSEENKALLRRAYQAMNEGNLAAMEQIFAANMVDHNPAPGQAPGIQGVKEMFTMMRAAFPDMRLTIDDMIAEGDKVAAHLSFRGTHKGEFMGMAPTGKQVTGRVSDIIRFAAGKAVERWGVEDMSGMFPAPGSLPGR